MHTHNSAVKAFSLAQHFISQLAIFLVAFLAFSAAYCEQTPGLLLSQLPGARQIYTQTLVVKDYAVALSGFEKQKNGWALKQYQFYSGSLSRTTIAIPVAVSAQEALHFYQKQLGVSRNDLLFKCAAKACGSNAAWAQLHFKNSLLIGREASQEYFIYLLGDVENQRTVVSFYVVAQGVGQTRAGKVLQIESLVLN